jgi:beta-glucosidase
MTPSPSRTLLGALGLAVCLAAPLRAADLYRDPAAPVEARVADLLPRLTAGEKLLLLGGDQDFYIRPIARLGLPAVKMADGPLGVRNYGPSTAYPATIGLAATWDAELGRRFGAAMGSDARARGVGIMLAPAVNITRVPVNGRNFEYLSEDPYLAGVFADQVVTGIQSQGVVATVKHFAANNQETDRGTIDVRVGERALREIYLPAFQAAVEKGHAWAVMDAYNRLNGTYCTANTWLNNQVLKGDWGFQGVVMSDWGAAHDTLGVANGGLDLEMPSGAYMSPAKLAPLLAAGQVTQATIDDKVRRILRLEVANGFLDRPQELLTPKDDPKSADVALQIEREAIVLLKNDYYALPLANKKLKRIVLLGPNADNFPVGGGSGHVESFHYVSVAEGLHRLLPKTKLDVFAGPGPALLARLAPVSRYEGPLSLKFFTGDWSHRKTVASLSDPVIDHEWTEAPAPGVALADYWAQWSGKIVAPADGTYVFLVRNHGNVAVNLDGKQILGSWSNPGDTLYTEVPLAAGSVHTIELWVRYDNLGSAGVHFAWGAAPPLLTPAEEERVRSADAVVVCAGFNLMLEGEGADRPFELPNGQPELIRRAAALNPRTIVVLNSGGSLATADWIGQVPAVLQAWYPGQEGGRAVAEVLTGKVNPSGKLPISFEQRWEDTPSFGHYPGAGGTVDYAEGLLVGYRWFDAKGVAPLFPFGHGLSFTTFHYDKFHVEPRTDGTWAVTFDVTNNGTMGGDEVAELYVSAPVTSKVQRPVRELKGFSRFTLATDQTANVTVLLDRNAFSYWDEKQHAWAVEPGTYTLEVGSSSRKILLSGAVQVD